MISTEEHVFVGVYSNTEGSDVVAAKDSFFRLQFMSGWARLKLWDSGVKATAVTVWQASGRDLCSRLQIKALTPSALRNRRRLWRLWRSTHFVLFRSVFGQTLLLFTVLQHSSTHEGWGNSDTMFILRMNCSFKAAPESLFWHLWLRRDDLTWPENI